MAGLFEVLREAELQQYHDRLKSELGVRGGADLKAASDDELERLGMCRAERRRLRKACDRLMGDTYLDRIRRMLKPHSPSAPAVASSSAAKHVIPCENITVNKEIGTGEFGVVQQGVWNREGRGVQVAIKCLYKEQMHTNAMDFLKEAAIMHDIDHENVVRLYGVVLHPQSLMLVTELAPLRSLLECLRETDFPPATLCEFAEQICRGMAHLEAKRLIHRDLAARNVLVFAKNRVKISDFGLSRALGAGEDYYRTNFNVNLKLPIAWCAPECIAYLRFTSASDVWAFGVTAWEMFSYGFQPWAAFNGREILAAVDRPNCQRLERPERCPAEYYELMLDCWAHEPHDRPKFSELAATLPERRPERVRAVSAPKDRRTETLQYRGGDVITVLDKTGARWKGALDSGSVGHFDPLNTVSYLASSLPAPFRRSSEGPRGSLVRNDRRSRRRLRSDMISTPQGEVKHTGHVGLDGAYFGDVSFLEGDGPPRLAVAPYRPSDDLEQTPLINPNSPSHLTADGSMLLREPIERADTTIPTGRPLQGASAPSPERRRGPAFSFDPPSISKRMSRFKWPKKKEDRPSREDDDGAPVAAKNPSPILIADENNDTAETDSQPHDYQEISDEEFGQSLLDEMELMFQSYGESSKSSNGNQDFNTINHKNELTELSSKLSHQQGTSKKKTAVKPISAHDQRTLDTAIALANKISEKSINDLDWDEPPGTPNATSLIEKSKFSFLFPLLGNGHSQNSVNGTKGSSDHGKVERRNFSQEAQSVPDIQTILTEESKLAYESLVEQPCRLETTVMKIKQKGVVSTLRQDLSSSMSKGDFETMKIRHNDAKDSADTTDGIKENLHKPPTNLIPLPPKDPTKHWDTGKRHVRKHPLVIQNDGHQSNNNVLECTDMFYSKPPPQNGCLTPEKNSNNNHHISLNPFDAPSLNFECQIENNLETVDCCDGFDFDCVAPTKETPNIFPTFSTFKPPHDRPPTQYENQTLHFIDDDDDANLMMDPMKRSPDRVSVEDLLEFADQKPCGRQRGTDSDEVRIMRKVLNGQVAPEACLLALEFASWNVHRAIKLAELKLMGLDSPTLYECSVALDGCEWDVARAAAMLADSSDVAQV